MLGNKGRKGKKRGKEQKKEAMEQDEQANLDIGWGMEEEEGSSLASDQDRQRDGQTGRR